MIICDMITSRNNSRIKWVSSLSDKKHRQEAKVFFVEGEKLMLEALDSSLPVAQIIVNENDLDRIVKMIGTRLDLQKYCSTEIIPVSKPVFDKISTEKSPEGVITLIKYLDFFRNIAIIYKEEFFLGANERALALCSVRDPGNLGSVIRSAAAFGVDHIILSSDCADIYNPRTLRAAMGSLFHVNVSIVQDFHAFVEAAKFNGRSVYAAELREDAKSLSDVDLNGNDIFIIGNEGHGIPIEIASVCTASVYIPISSKTESLNASVAAALFMWEQSKH